MRSELNSLAAAVKVVAELDASMQAAMAAIVRQLASDGGARDRMLSIVGQLSDRQRDAMQQLLA